MQKRDVFTLQQIQKIEQQYETETEMLSDSDKIISELSENCYYMIWLSTYFWTQ